MHGSSGVITAETTAATSVRHAPGQFYLHVCTYNSHFAPLLTTSIQCMNCHWHYLFPVAISSRNTAFPEAPVSRCTGLGILQPNEKNGCSGCLGQLCGRSTHGSCGNWCCRTCCIINGGCHLWDHKETQLSKNRLQKFNCFNCNNPTITFPPSNSQRPPLLLHADTPTIVTFPPLNS